MPTPDDVDNWKDQEGEAADMAQAYRDLARGEQAAAAIEANLSRFEDHVQSLLDAVQAGVPPPSYSSSTTLAAAGPPYASTADLAAARAAADDNTKSKANDKSRGDKKPQNGDGRKQN